jgi:CubicO group peptidase (beta-lactamase class C family)
VNYPAIPGQDLRGFGWDIDTALSRPRGLIFPVGSFGQGGFTGVTLWIDPASDSYVIVLANVIHQRGGPPVVTLSGDIATTAARVLHLYGS